MAKPGTVATWATSGSAFKSDPGAPKRALGWLAAEKPPADWFNWFANLQGQWFTYLDGLTGEALTWTANHIFSLLATFSAGVLARQTADSSPVFETDQDPAGTYKLLFQFGNSVASFGKIRIYVSSTRAFSLTINCAWNQGSGLWVRDTGSGGGARYDLTTGTGGFSQVLTKNSAASWADNAWETTSAGNGLLSGNSNRVCGVVTVNAGVGTINSSFGVLNVGTITADSVQINFFPAMPSANYGVIPVQLSSGSLTAPIYAMAHSRATGSVKFSLYDTAGVRVDLTASAGTFAFIVFCY